MPLAAPRRQSGFAALILALLLAVTWQSFVTQTHNHYDQGFASAGVQANGGLAGKAGKSDPSRLPDNCSICREIAHAGPVLLSAPVEIAAPIAIALWIAVVLPLGLALVSRSHAWRSRAPPKLLQA